MRNVRLAVALVFGLCITICGAEETGFKSSPKPMLEASLSGDDVNPVLTIRLRNTGDVPIVVDKELVFLPHIEPVDNERRVMPLKETRSLEKPAVSVLKSRLATLKPGEEIERKVRLRKGFKEFVTGISIPIQSGGSEAPKVTAYEGICQMPANVRPSEIWVSYDPPYSFEKGFMAYMQDINVAQFYRGPLHVRVPYRFAKDTIGGQGERPTTTKDSPK